MLFGKFLPVLEANLLVFAGLLDDSELLSFFLLQDDEEDLSAVLVCPCIA